MSANELEYYIGENLRLQNDLDSARREVFHLKHEVRTATLVPRGGGQEVPLGPCDGDP
jgi:hypothetical protein